MEGAEDQIKIIDRYFDDNALELIRTVVPKKEELVTHILTAVDDERRDDLVQEYKNLIDPSRSEIRVIDESGETPHDRFIIIDGAKIWQVGHSLNGLGKDFSTIFLHSEEEAHHYIELFDELWETSEKLGFKS